MATEIRNQGFLFPETSSRTKNPAKQRRPVNIKGLLGDETSELSELWNLVNGLVTAHPARVPRLWEELGTTPLDIIHEETSHQCSKFASSAAPFPPSEVDLPIITIRPPTPQPFDPVGLVSPYEVEEPRAEISEFVWSPTHYSLDLHVSDLSAYSGNAKESTITNRYYENPLNEVWIINNTWLTMAAPDDAHFSRAEALFAKKTYQAGIGQVDVALRDTSLEVDDSIELHTHTPISRRHSIPPSPVLHGCLATKSTISSARTINLHLLKSCALLACEFPDRALEVADEAMDIAEEKKIYYMVCKSQLYRGLALMELERWRDASFAFTRAANVRGWAMRIPKLKREADKNLQAALVKLSVGS